MAPFVVVAAVTTALVQLSEAIRVHPVAKTFQEHRAAALRASPGKPTLTTSSRFPCVVVPDGVYWIQSREQHFGYQYMKVFGGFTSNFSSITLSTNKDARSAKWEIRNANDPRDACIYEIRSFKTGKILHGLLGQIPIPATIVSNGAAAGVSRWRLAWHPETKHFDTIADTPGHYTLEDISGPVQPPDTPPAARRYLAVDAGGFIVNPYVVLSNDTNTPRRWELEWVGDLVIRDLVREFSDPVPPCMAWCQDNLIDTYQRQKADSKCCEWAYRDVTMTKVAQNYGIYLNASAKEGVTEACLRSIGRLNRGIATIFSEVAELPALIPPIEVLMDRAEWFGLADKKAYWDLKQAAARETELAFTRYEAVGQAASTGALATATGVLLGIGVLVPPVGIPLAVASGLLMLATSSKGVSSWTTALSSVESAETMQVLRELAQVTPGILWCGFTRRYNEAASVTDYRHSKTSLFDYEKRVFGITLNPSSTVGAIASREKISSLKDCPPHISSPFWKRYSKILVESFALLEKTSLHIIIGHTRERFLNTTLYRVELPVLGEQLHISPGWHPLIFVMTIDEKCQDMQKIIEARLRESVGVDRPLSIDCRDCPYGLDLCDFKGGTKATATTRDLALLLRMDRVLSDTVIKPQTEASPLLLREIRDHKKEAWDKIHHCSELRDSYCGYDCSCWTECYPVMAFPCHVPRLRRKLQARYRFIASSTMVIPCSVGEGSLGDLGSLPISPYLGHNMTHLQRTLCMADYEPPEVKLSRTSQ